MKKIGFIICLIILTSNVFGQQISTNQSTSLCGGHWEIFLSSISLRITFKIDKYTGAVFELVQQYDKTLTWQFVGKDVRSTDVQKADTINYQLFTSGLGSGYTFLMNTNTGLTWKIVTIENGAYYFQAVE